MSSETQGAAMIGPRWLVVAILLASMSLPWASAWDHPLHTPDEGRYGSVSAGMAEQGEWIVPHFRGLPHLTKPPLIYWLQSGSIELLGRSELALRLPSLIAGSLSCLVVFLFVRRMRGEAMAMVAVGLYGVMPLPLVFARMATIDGVLNFFWIAALASAAIAVDTRRRAHRGGLAWLALAWLAVACAALVKGPVAPAPMVIIAVWLALAGRWRELRWFMLHGLWGAALALAPIGAWVVVIAQRFPEVWDVWRAQFIDRFAVGLPAQPLTADSIPSGSSITAEQTDIEPFWFYLPIFLAGMLPATCALTLPWFNMRLREALRAFLLGDLRALLLVATVGPLLFFSIAKGKMPAYIVPIAAPTAILVAGMLMRVVTRSRHELLNTHLPVETPGAALGDVPLVISKDPDVRLTFATVMTLGVVGGGIAASILGGAWGAREMLTFVPIPLLALYAAAEWRKGEEGRRRALLMQWLCMVTVAILMMRLEHRTLIDLDMGARGMITRVKQCTGSDRPQIVIYNFRNPTVDYYADGDPLMVWSESDLRGLWPKLRPDHAILVPETTWRWVETEFPRLAAAFSPICPESDGDADDPSPAIWNRWPGKPTVMLRMLGPPEADDYREPGSVPPEPHE